MAFRYLNLLLRYVSAHFNKFHTVEQRTRYSVEVVGGCNEEHLREVVVNIKIVVVEGVVLFRVEHLKQGR